MAARLNITIPPGTERTLKLLRHIVSNSLHERIFPAFEVVSSNRRLADHEKRPAAASMKAFEQFNSDMMEIVKALSLLKGNLADHLGVTVDSCVKRKEALSTWYPKFDDELKVQPNYAICRISEAVGKTISRVEIGFRKQAEGAHNSELMILYFDDDSSIAIHTGANAGNLASIHDGLKPEDLNISFVLNYVPPLLPRST